MVVTHQSRQSPNKNLCQLDSVAFFDIQEMVLYRHLLPNNLVNVKIDNFVIRLDNFIQVEGWINRKNPTPKPVKIEKKN